MALDLKYIEKQLGYRIAYPYHWGQRQNDFWDNRTNFIYKTATWDELQNLIKLTREAYELDHDKFFQYATNRWFNYWSARAIEQIFTEIDGVVPAINHKDRLVDFSIKGINFDHKTSVFPKGFNQTINYAQQHPKELLKWLYTHQSQQKRKHLKNRLFIVVYDPKHKAHWKLKADIFWLKSLIQQYMQTYRPEQLYHLQLTPHNAPALADIIWAIK